MHACCLEFFYAPAQQLMKREVKFNRAEIGESCDTNEMKKILFWNQNWISINNIKSMYEFQKSKTKIENSISADRFTTPKLAMFHWNIGFGGVCAFNQTKNSFPRTSFALCFEFGQLPCVTCISKICMPICAVANESDKTRGTTTHASFTHLDFVQLIHQPCESAWFDNTHNVCVSAALFLLIIIVTSSCSIFNL